MAQARGFGIAGALDHKIATELAVAAEAAGYSTFWANDTPNGEGLALLAAVAKETERIQLGVGVIPVDRTSAETIASRIHELELPVDRLIVGIGSGGLTRGAREAVSAAAIELGTRTTARIVVGSLGPKMCAVAGETSDGALLSWLTPEYAPQLVKIIQNAAAKAGRPTPWLAAYMRVGLEGPGGEKAKEEALRYGTYPAYKAHFEREGVGPIETCGIGDASAIQAKLASFGDGIDEFVVRAIAGEETVESYLDVLNASAPNQ